MKISKRHIAWLMCSFAWIFAKAQSSSTLYPVKKLFFIDSTAAKIQYNQLFSTQENYENWQLRQTNKFQMIHLGNEEVLNLQIAMKPWLLKNNISPGIYFPTVLAGNNNPELFPTTTTGNWIYASAAEKNPLLKPGISGYAAQTEDVHASIKISIPSEFQKVTDRLRIYCDRQENSYDIQVKTSNSATKIFEIHGYKSDQHQQYVEIPITSGCKFIEITFKKYKETQNQFTLHGLSLENSLFPTYHFIGIRGNNFTVMSDFSQWLLSAKKINPQMLIVDLFQGDIFRFNDGVLTMQKAESFTSSARRFLTKSTITWIIPQEMFRGNTTLESAEVLQQAVDFKFRNSRIKMEPMADFVFDWYRIAGGKNSSYYWVDSGLLKPYFPALTDLGMGVKSKFWSQSLHHFLNTIPENTVILSPIDTLKRLKKPIKDTIITRTISKETFKYHIVKRGETAYRIASRYGITPNQLKSWNNLRGYYIYPGQRLKVGKSVSITFENITIPKNQPNLTADDFNPATGNSGATGATAAGNTGTTGSATGATTTTSSGTVKIEDQPKTSPITPNPTTNTTQVPKPKVEDQPKASPQNPPATVDNPLLKVRYHRVENGETLYSISKKYEVTVASLRQLNRLPNNTIAVGRVLRIR